MILEYLTLYENEYSKGLYKCLSRCFGMAKISDTFLRLSALICNLNRLSAIKIGVVVCSLKCWKTLKV